MELPLGETCKVVGTDITLPEPETGISELEAEPATDAADPETIADVGDTGNELGKPEKPPDGAIEESPLPDAVGVEAGMPGVEPIADREGAVAVVAPVIAIADVEGTPDEPDPGVLDGLP